LSSPPAYCRWPTPSNTGKYGRYLAIAISLLLAAFGSAWFIDRAFNLELMQRFGL